MKIYELKKYGVGDNLIKLYEKEGYIVINYDNASIVSDDFAVRLFLSEIDKNYEFAKKIAWDVGLFFSSNYLKMLISLCEGNLGDAGLYLDKLKKKQKYFDEFDELRMYDFILNNVTSDFSLPYQDNEYLCGYMNIVRKYILLRKFKIAADIVSKVLEIEDSKSLEILKNTLDVVPCNIKYMVDDNYQVNDMVTYNGLAKLERRLIVSYELEDYETFGKTLDNLFIIMHDKTFIKNINKLLSVLNELKSNKKRVLKHSVDKKNGDIDDIMVECASSYELYDICDFVKEKNKEGHFSIKNHLYGLILDDIMDINKKNLHYVVLNDLDVDRAKISLDKYSELINSGKKKDAKKLLRDLGSGLENYDYMVKEIDINYANRDIAEKVNSICESADNSLDPFVILKSYRYALMLQRKKDPLCYMAISAAYEEQGNYAEALHYLEDSEKIFVYPDTYLKMMELFIKCKRYDKVFEYHEKYETYCPMVSSYDYYLLSIAYMNVCKYEEALRCLDIADEINHKVNHVLYFYDKERSIIKSLIYGESKELYEPDDFVAFEIDEGDLDIVDDLNSCSVQDNNGVINYVLECLKGYSSVRDAMLYLLNMVKILVLTANTDMRESLEFIISMIEKYDTKDEVKKYVLDKINVYKSIVKL